MCPRLEGTGLTRSRESAGRHRPRFRCRSPLASRGPYWFRALARSSRAIHKPRKLLNATVSAVLISKCRYGNCTRRNGDIEIINSAARVAKVIPRRRVLLSSWVGTSPWPPVSKRDWRQGRNSPRNGSLKCWCQLGCGKSALGGRWRLACGKSHVASGLAASSCHLAAVASIRCQQRDGIARTRPEA